MKHLVNIPTEYRNQTHLPSNDAPFVERQGENRLQQALDVTDAYALDLEEVMFVMTSDAIVAVASEPNDVNWAISVASELSY
eukprot:scaffold28883_cov166-Skeletonema_menzelii.AAC.1